MLLPEQFWRSVAAGGGGLRGGVEWGFMSTTTDRRVAVQYSGRDRGRGTVFEIAAGRVDIGADLSWVSQYPGEREFLFPPLSCLEVSKGGKGWQRSRALTTLQTRKERLGFAHVKGPRGCTSR